MAAISCADATPDAAKQIPHVPPGQHLVIAKSPPVIRLVSLFSDSALDDQTGSYQTVPTRDLAFGPVAVFAATERSTRAPERVVICATPDYGDGEALARVDGRDVSVHGSSGKIVRNSSNRLECVDPSTSSIVWVENGWMLRAASIDGDVDRALAAANATRIDGDGRISVTLPIEDGLVLVGQLDNGWNRPADGANHVFAAAPTYSDSGGYERWFSVAAIIVDAAQRRAMVGRMLDAPGPIAGLASTPVYDNSFGPPTEIDVDGATVMVGGWGVSSIAAVVQPSSASEPGVALVAATSSGAEGSATLPSARQLAAMAAATVPLDGTATQEMIDAASRGSYEAAIESASRTRVPGADPQIVPTDYGSLLLWLTVGDLSDTTGSHEDPAFQQLNFQATRVFLPDGRPSRTNPSVERQPRAMNVDADVLEIPDMRAPTFDAPYPDTPDEPTHRFDVVVHAGRGVDVEVTVGDGSPQSVDFNEVTEVLSFDGVDDYEPVAYDLGDRWGHLVVDAPNGIGSIAVIGTPTN